MTKNSTKDIRIKKGIRYLIATFIMMAFVFYIQSAHSSASNAETAAETYDNLSADQIVADMGAGWNLGNTFDGHTDLTPSETDWQDVVTTQKLIKSVHDSGFNTIRIPVTWGTMINENDYSINEDWLARIKEVIDYARHEGMYVIINMHHDGASGDSYWLNPFSDDLDKVYDKFGGAWKSISTYFKNYDEHLIFESMNEVEGDDKVILKLNQIFVDNVRSTGGNNDKRWLSIPGSGANIGNAQLNFKFPKDTVENRLFFAVHYYDWSFGLEESTDTTTFSEIDAQNLIIQLKYLKKFFTAKGIPVILGEYGCIDKNNESERAYFDEVSTRICKNGGIVPVYWDNGYHDSSKEVDYGFSLFDRTTGNAWYPEIIQGMMRGYFNTGKVSDVVKKPDITAVTSIQLSSNELTMLPGDEQTVDTTVEPATNNDVIIWRSEDENVATVYNGKITAVGKGTTDIVAFSQSGDVSSTIKLTVSDGSNTETTGNTMRSNTSSIIVIALSSIFMVIIGFGINNAKSKRRNK